MSRRLHSSCSVVAAFMGMAWLVPMVVVAQPVSGVAPISKTATLKSGKAKEWTPPRTPWGDPDLSGNFTDKSEQGTPFERPKEFEGRRIEDITGAELAQILRERQDRIVGNARPADGGVHAPLHWSDRFEITKGSRAWFVVDPPDGKIPPSTPEAQRRAAARAARRNNGHGPADGPEDRSLYDRCITRGLPNSMLPTIYGNSYQIVQGQGFVAIRYEMVHETRIIPLDGRPHIGSSIREHMGDGRGHWEGNTLVVETTNFTEESAYRGADPRTLRLVERFTRISPDQVMWAVTVEDPNTWTRPWTFSLPLTMNDSEAIFEYACHEGNYGLRNILSAARAEDEDAKKGIVRPSASSSESEGEEAR